MKNNFASVSLLAIVACILWSTAFATIKYGLQYTGPLNFAGIRFMLSGLMIFLVTTQRNQYWSMFKAHAGFILKLSFFQTFLIYALFYLGLSMAPASLAAMINGSSPLFVALLAHFIIPGDQLNWKKTVIILMGLTGVGLIVASRGNIAVIGSRELMGIVLLILANLSGSYGNVLVSASRKDINPLVLTGLQIFIGGFFLFLISIPFEGFHFVKGPWTYWVLLLYLGFLSAAAFSIWFTLLRRPGVKVTTLNFWKFIIPVLGAILGWIFIPGEKPEWLPVSGMLLISIALLWMNGAEIWYRMKASFRRNG